MAEALGQRLELALAARLDRARRLLDAVAAEQRVSPRQAHQVRVVSRKAQAAVKTTAVLTLGKGDGALLKQLRSIRRAAGEVRNLDVVIDWLAEQEEQRTRAVAFALGMLCAQRDSAAGRFIQWADARRRDRFARAVRDRLDCVAKQLASLRDDEASRALGEAVERAGEKARRRTKEALERPSVEATHKARLALKRLRYAVEFVADAAGARESCQPALQELAMVQDALGRRNDAAERVQLLRRLCAHAERAGAPSSLVEEMRRMVRRCTVEDEKADAATDASTTTCALLRSASLLDAACSVTWSALASFTTERKTAATSADVAE